jgi:polyhydroxyalkanoate synthesis regulator protein
MNPMAAMPGFDAMRAQQEAFMKAMTGGMSGQWSGPGQEPSDNSSDRSATEELDEIKRQLADLQSKLSKM